MNQPKGRAQSRTHSNTRRTPRRSTQTASRPTRRTNTRQSGGPRRNSSQRRSSTPRPTKRREQRTLPPKRVDDVIPPLTEGVRVIPLGGVEEVGKNMTVIETPDDIFVFDCGFQFTSDDGAPGIDYVLPNTRYLEERKDKIRGVLVTHAHLDHIGGIPFIMPRIGNPPIYTLPLTSIMIKKRNTDFPHLPEMDIKTIKVGEKFKLGKTNISTFPVTHSIPDSVGFVVETPYGNIIISGDMKLEHDGEQPSEAEQKKWGELGKMNNLLLIADSTNAENPGFSVPETTVINTIEEIIRDVKGRLIIGTFASQFERMIKIISASEKLGKKIVTEGRSIKNNIEIAEKAGLLKVKKGTIIPAQEIDSHPAEKIVVIATGAQGEEHAALMRIATNRHRNIKFTERDTVVLSSSVIPGNELAVQRLKDNLYRHNVRLMHYRASDVHSTGHGNIGELVWINKQVGAKYFMPAYGYYSMTHCHAQGVVDAGFPRENIILADNGSLIDFTSDKGFTQHKEKAPAAPMLVDGFSIGDTQEVVMKDRQALAQDGMFVIIAMVNIKTGKLKKSPDIISRGFVYLRESQDLLAQTRLIAKKNVEQSVAGMNPIDFDLVKKELAESIGTFLLQKTNKTPLVIPVILGI